jgi:Bacterial Ig-like domain
LSSTNGGPGYATSLFAVDGRRATDFLALSEAAVVLATRVTVAGEPLAASAIRVGTQGVADRPKVVSVSPPDDATDVAPLSEIRIRFDRAMNPTRTLLEWEPHGVGFRLRGEMRYSADIHEFVVGQPEYDPAKHRFSIMLSMPANWNGEVTLKGFLGEDGVDAGPIVLKYRTMRRPFSEPLQAKVDGTGKG